MDNLDTLPNTESFNEEEACKNCEQILQDKDSLFCSNCGQKLNLPKASIGTLLKDFFGNLFTIESKLIATLTRLCFNPGYLSLAYKQGKRIVYYTPARLFLFTITIHFILFQLFAGIPMEEEHEIQREFAKVYYVDSFYQKIQPFLEDSNQIKKITDVYSQIARLDSDVFSGENAVFRYENKGTGEYAVDIELVQLILGDIELFYQFREAGTPLEKAFARRMRHFMTYPYSFLSFFSNNISWVMFLIIPFSALWLKLLYRKANNYYVEHAVFSLHLHAFFFIMLTILYMIIWNIESDTWFYNWIFITVIVMLGYLYRAIGVYYQQSRWMTILKSISFLILYLLSFLVLMFGLLIYAFAFS